MRLKTIFIIVITILLTVVIMQNADPVTLKILFFSTRTSKLLVLLVIAVLAFIAGFLAGRPRRTDLSKDYNHGYNEYNPDAERTPLKPESNTLSDEDRDYISED